jgi:putative membrane protein
MKKFSYFLAASFTLGMLLPTASALTKNETVYTKLNYDGTVSNVTVTNQLVSNKKEEIEDESELLEILNLKGNEKLQVEGKSLKWQSDGKDIFYQGTSEKTPDIQVNVEYFLDDEKVDVNSILGKKGHIKIVYNFTNNMKNTVTVNGQKEELYTPFLVTLGTMISQDTNQNLSISSGKVITNGTKYMVLGMSSPGLYESLKIEELKDLNTITLEYDTTSFSLSQTYFVMTPKLLEEEDLSIFDDLKDVYRSLDSLKENMDVIEEGTTTLKEGTVSIKDGSQTITDSLNKVLTSVKALESGSKKVTSGLNDVLTSLKAAESSMSFDNETYQSLSTLKSGNDAAITKLKAVNETYESTYTTYQLKTATQETLAALVPAEQVEKLLTLKETYEGNETLITLLEKNNEAITKVLSTFETLQTTISSMISNLEEGVGTLYTGSSQISTGLTSLQTGLEKIYNGSVSLSKGTNQLEEGATTLESGVKRFNKEGISKLIGYKNKVASYTNKIEALTELSKEYNGYASSNSTNTVFVSTISSLKK